MLGRRPALENTIKKLNDPGEKISLAVPKKSGKKLKAILITALKLAQTTHGLLALAKALGRAFLVVTHQTHLTEKAIALQLSLEHANSTI